MKAIGKKEKSKKLKQHTIQIKPLKGAAAQAADSAAETARTSGKTGLVAQAIASVPAAAAPKAAGGKKK